LFLEGREELGYGVHEPCTKGEEAAAQDVATFLCIDHAKHKSTWVLGGGAGCGSPLALAARQSIRAMDRVMFTLALLT
jgi:hypothetical protein